MIEITVVDEPTIDVATSQDQPINISNTGEVIRGIDGVTFTPSVSASGVISWTNDGGRVNPNPVNIKGADGEDGTDGEDGEDGFSPVANVVKAGNKSTITITDKTGTTTVEVDDGIDGQDGTDGIDGEDGEDGYSPTANVTKVGNKSTITITDKNGTTSAEVNDGQDGQDGLTTSVTVNGVTHTQVGGNIDLGTIGGSPSWGEILGTLANQTDLQNALDAKPNIDDTSTSSTSNTWSASKLNAMIGNIESTLQAIRGV